MSCPQNSWGLRCKNVSVIKQAVSLRLAPEEKFRTGIYSGFWVSKQNIKFFPGTKVAYPHPITVWISFTLDVPSYFVRFLVFLELPDMGC